MKHFADKRIWVAAATMAICTACVSTSNSGINVGESRTNTLSQAGSSAEFYGEQYAVRATVGTIKSQGNVGHMSSRAIRLPERPLGEIAVFGYQFPATCGGHEFRVYEAEHVQILEYQYAALNGESRMIRDYISGPSPFVEPGLWTAYDHTADSISTMTSQFEQRGDSMFNGVYSQGLVTNLSAGEQRALGNAYRQALSDVYNCRDTQALAEASAN